MLTIFSIPKSFKGHIGIIQRNAIISWTLIRPRPEIILFGDDKGTAEVARDLGVRHMREIATNQYGTPLLNDCFRRAETYSLSQLMCYVNTDILLLGDFKRAVEQVSKRLKKFLIVSRRINIDVMEQITFEADWEASLRKQARESGTSGQHTSIDIFAFPRGTYSQIPDFGIGRLWFDQWLIKAARESGIPVVDLSPVAPVLHQNHDYNHVAGGADWIWKGKEAEHNLRLYGGVEHAYTLLDVTHELRAGGQLKRVPFRKLRFNLWKWSIHNTFSLRRGLGLRRKADLSADRKPMLTIFAIPRAFQGHVGTIQRNAIRSWTVLRPRPEVLLFGSELGTGEICRELGLRHIPEVNCTLYGAPLLPDLFRRARESAQNSLLCYVNADIILLSDFSEALQEVGKVGRRFLMVARRWDVFLDWSWDFAQEDAAEKLREYVLKAGKQGPLPGNSDFFLFPKDLWSTIPALAIGRASWDAWLVYEARRLGAAVVDASSAVMAIHQSHDQSSYPHGLRQWRTELDLNHEIAGEDASRFCLYDATHLLAPGGLQRPMGLSYLTRRVDTLSLFHPRLAAPVQIPRMLIAAARAVRRNRALARDPVRRLVKLICSKLPKSGITSILGLFHSPGNGHAEETRGLQLAHSLVWGGFPVVVYDPRPAAMERARQMLGGPIEFARSAEDCIREGDVVVIAAPCPEFRQIPTEAFFSSQSKRVVIDCCDSLSDESARQGLQYVQCRQG